MSNPKKAPLDPKKQKQQKIVLMIMLLVGIIYGLYALIFAPMLEELDKLEANLKKSLQDENKLKATLSKELKVKEDFHKNQLILSCMEKDLFPPRMNAVVWIGKFAQPIFAKNKIVDAARGYREAGVKNLLSKSDNPKDAKNRYYLEDFQLDLTALGSYENIGNLLGDFEQEIPYSTVSGFTIISNNDKQVNLTLNLLVPRLNSAGITEFEKVKNFQKNPEVKK
ncbi:MAG: hypothetical protein ACRC37_02485 [Lentisphaeria bacterium]